MPCIGESCKNSRNSFCRYRTLTNHFSFNRRAHWNFRRADLFGVKLKEVLMVLSARVFEKTKQLKSTNLNALLPLQVLSNLWKANRIQSIVL